MRQADLHEQPYETLRDQVRDYYDNFLGYLENDLDHANPRHARVLQALEQRAKPGMRVLDLGCGIGITTRALRKMNGGAETVGVDLSPALIGKAQTLSEATFHVADVTELALGRRFDLLCMVDALEHIAPSRYAALWDVFAAHAAPGATLYLNLPNPRLLETLQEETPEALQILDESVPLDTMIALAYARGFQLLTMSTYALWRPEEYVELTFRAPGVAEEIAPETHAEQPATTGDGQAGLAPEAPAILVDPRAPLKLGVWAGDGNNTHFLDPILKKLPERYEIVRMGEGGSATEIGLGLKEVDAAFFEWAVGPAAVGSQKSADVPTLVRLHRYEAYTEWPRQIAWKNVDDLVFVSDGVRRSFGELNGESLVGPQTRVHVIPNGIDVADYPFDAARRRTFDIAFVGRLHLVKNPMLLVQLMGALVKRDPRFTLHIAGGTQHIEAYRYLRYHAEQMGIAERVKIYGHLGAEELRGLLGQCSYLVTTSVIEGHPVGLMEGMAMGLKPVIHDFYGARDLFPAEFIWNGIDEAVRMLTRGGVEPQAYRRFIEEHYSLEDAAARFTAILDRSVADYQPDRLARLLDATRAPSLCGEAAEARVQQAQTYAEAGDFEQALAAFAAVDFDSLPGDLHLRARILALQSALHTGQATEALRHADAATDLAPDEPLALNLAGRALWMAGQHRAAMETLVLAAERTADGTAALPFDAAALRRDAADACEAMGMSTVAAQFAV